MCYLLELLYLYNAEEQNQYHVATEGLVNHFIHTSSYLLIIHRSAFLQSRDRDAQHEKTFSTEQTA